MDDQQHPVVKLTLAWGGVGFSKWLDNIGIHTWSDFAALLAAIYSLFLICDWLWKKWSKR